MKKQKTVSIKAKLLGVIIPVVIAGCLSDICRDDQKIFPEFTAVFGREPGIPDRSMAE